MQTFLKKIILFSCLLLLILLVIFKQTSGSFIIKERLVLDKELELRKKFFESFISNKQKINLILGSSLTEVLLIPEILGENWFTFSNGSQNIYESLKFLKYYDSSIKIDTILIGIQPFDFPTSLKQDFLANNSINMNGNFYIFGEDSLIKGYPQRNRYLQIFKDKYFPKLFFKNEKKLNMSNKGFIDRSDFKSVNLDSIYKFHAHQFNLHNTYYHNVPYPPNMNYFDLFNNYVINKEIKTFYLSTPKSKYYRKGVSNSDNKFTWSAIVDSIRTRNVNFLNYENLNTEAFEINWYVDETHGSHYAAKIFTEMIYSRLSKW